MAGHKAEMQSVAGHQKSCRSEAPNLHASPFMPLVACILHLLHLAYVLIQNGKHLIACHVLIS